MWPLTQFFVIAFCIWPWPLIKEEIVIFCSYHQLPRLSPWRAFWQGTPFKVPQPRLEHGELQGNKETGSCAELGAKLRWQRQITTDPTLDGLFVENALVHWCFPDCKKSTEWNWVSDQTWWWIVRVVATRWMEGVRTSSSTIRVATLVPWQVTWPPNPCFNSRPHLPLTNTDKWVRYFWFYCEVSCAYEVICKLTCFGFGMGHYSQKNSC